MPSPGLEPGTSPLPRECSTAELQGRVERWAGLDLNQRRQSQRIYSPPPLTTRAPTPNHVKTLPVKVPICLNLFGVLN